MISFSFYNASDLQLPKIKDSCVDMYNILPESDLEHEKQYCWLLQCFYERKDRLRSVLVHKTKEFILVEALLVWLDQSEREQKKLIRSKMNNEETLSFINAALSGSCEAELLKMEFKNITNKNGGTENGI